MRAGDLQPRLPWADLGAVVDTRGLSMSELARESRIDRRVILRWKAEGELPERAADRIAVAIGLTPELVWGEAWARLGREAAERAEVERRARVAAKQRRYAARHPEYVEQRRQYSLAYRQQYPEASRAYARTYYQQNRERMIRQAVERKQQKRAELQQMNDGEGRTNVA